MDLVGPRLHLKADRAAAGSSVFCWGICGLELELLNGVGRDLEGSQVTLEFICGWNIRTVEYQRRAAHHAAADHRAHRPAHALTRVTRRALSRHARRQLHELRGTSLVPIAGQRQIFHFPAGDRGSDVRTLALEQGNLSGDLHGLSLCANGQGNIQAGRLTNLNENVGLFVFSETCLLCGQLVRGSRQERNRIYAALVSFHIIGDSGPRVGDCDRHIGDYGATRVRHDSGDRTPADLCPYGASHQQRPHQYNKCVLEI